MDDPDDIGDLHRDRVDEMNRMINELPGRGLHLLLMGAAAHEVECEGHVAIVAVQGRLPQRIEPELPVGDLDTADLDRLFRGAYA